MQNQIKNECLNTGKSLTFSQAYRLSIQGSQLTYTAKSNKKRVFEYLQKFNIHPSMYTERDSAIKFKVVN